MRRTFYAGFFVTLLVLVLSSCATGSRHPALKNARLPDLIPLRHLVVHKDSKFNYRIIFYRKLEDLIHIDEPNFLKNLVQKHIKHLDQDSFFGLF